MICPRGAQKNNYAQEKHVFTGFHEDKKMKLGLKIYKIKYKNNVKLLFGYSFNKGEDVIT